MKGVALAGTALLLFPNLPALGAETLREFTCRPAEVQGLPGQPTTVTVLTVPQPGISMMRYALIGEVRYEDVEGQGYLEMWSHFGERGRFFSRSLGAGPMQPLTGSSGWRGFALPFYITDGSFPLPDELVLNVVLPGSGRVEIRGVALRQFGANEDPTQLPGQWWGVREAALLGGIGGALVGCLGAMIGVLSARGQERRLVLGTMRFLIVFGAVALVLGLYARAVSQPYAVHYPFLLLGGISLAIGAGLYRRIGARYAALELRKMQAQDG